MNNHEFKVNICHNLDPTSPKTWSGTPKNLHDELCRLNRNGLVINTETPFGLKHILSFCSLLLYGNKEYARQPLRRYLSSITAYKKTGRSDTPHTLHTNSLSLPFIKKPSNQKHYLYCDYTWNLWANSTSMDGYPRHAQTKFEELEQRSLNQFDHIFSTSQYVKANIINHYNIPPEKISVVGTGLGVIKPFYGLKNSNTKKILFAAKGRFSDKGGEQVIEAFQQAYQKDDSLKLTIVGSNEALRYNSYPGITTHGFLPLSDLQNLFDSHNLFLMPAINEPWGLVYLEAMACKMPIMGSNSNSFPELSNDGKFGFILPNNDTESIADSLLTSFQNPEKLREMGEAAHKYCLSNFTWEKCVEKILSSIREYS